MFPRLRALVRALTARRAFEAGLTEELRFHIQAFAEDLVRSGVPPDEAHRRARIEFGGLECAKEECRDARGVTFLETLFQDLRFGLRPVYTLKS